MKKRLILLLLSCVILLSGCVENPYDRDDKDEDATTISETKETSAPTTTSTTQATTVSTTAETSASTAATTVDPNAVVIGGISIIYDYEELSHSDSDATILMTASLQNVTVAIAGYDSAAVVINDTLNVIRSESTETYDLMRTDAQSVYDDYGMEGLIGSYDLIATVEPSYVSDKLISFVVTRYSYSGGAHGNVMLEAYTFDTRTGDLLTFSDLCSDESLFEGFVESSIIAQIDAVPPEDQMIDPGYETAVVSELDSAIWYFSENGGTQLVVMYQSYSIAPYAAGTPTFAIPLTDCSTYFNAYGQALFTE